MIKPAVGDIWNYDNKFDYLVTESVEPPYDNFFKAIKLIDGEHTVVMPGSGADKHIWHKVA